MMSLNHDYIKLYFMYCLATCMSSINKLMCCFRQVINSDTGPGSTMAEAIWHSSDTTNEATLLWQDPDLQNWQPELSYRWFIQHQPSTGYIKYDC